MIPGQDAPIAFSSDRGTARAWLGRPVRFESLPVDDRTVLLRMRNMARHGVHTTRRRIAYAEAVRTGRVTPDETAKFIAELHADLSYSEEQDRCYVPQNVR
jgi:hypothetical protein